MKNNILKSYQNIKIEFAHTITRGLKGGSAAAERGRRGRPMVPVVYVLYCTCRSTTYVTIKSSADCRPGIVPEHRFLGLLQREFEP